MCVAIPRSHDRLAESPSSSIAFEYRCLTLCTSRASNLLWFSLLAGFLVVYIISSLFEWYRLRKFRGPFLASFSTLWLIRNALSGRSAERLMALHQKYGSIVKIGPNHLYTDDVEIIKRMSAPQSQYRRSRWYKATRVHPQLDHMMSMRDTATHDRLKSQTAFGYRGQENPNLEADIDLHIGKLVYLLRRKYVSSGDKVRPLDLCQAIQFFVIDTITKLAYGRGLGHLKADADVYDYFRTIEDFMPVAQLQNEVPWINRILSNPLLLELMGPSPDDEDGIGKLMGLSRKLVAERFGPDAKDHKDMLGAFVRHGLTQRQCEAEVLAQIFAGTETTATAIRVTMLYILTTPRVLWRLREEIAASARAGLISRPITNAQGNELPYLQAVIHEGLRIHPPFSGLLSKEVPAGGDILDGRYVPAGTCIGHSVFSMMRNKAVFGEDVDVFRPERWLDASPQGRARMHHTAGLGFGSGRWTCAGKTVALIQLNKIFVELLRRFDFQLIYPLAPMANVNHNVFYQKHMWVRVTER